MPAKHRVWFILLSSAGLPQFPMSCRLRPPSFGLLLPRPTQFWCTPPYTLMNLNETSVSDSLADNASCLSPGILHPVPRLFLSSWSSWVLFPPFRTGQGCWEPRSTQDCLHPSCETRDYKWLNNGSLELGNAKAAKMEQIKALQKNAWKNSMKNLSLPPADTRIQPWKTHF